MIDVISVTGALVMTLDRTDNPDLGRLAAGSYMLLVKTRDGRPLSLLRVIKIN